MAVIISLHSRAEHISARQRTPDNTQWQSSRAPLVSWSKLIAEALGGIAIIIASMWVLSNLAEWYAAWEGISL